MTSAAQDGPITTVISDYGGVLTTPLMGAFQKLNERYDLPDPALNLALMNAGEKAGTNLLFDLECGRIAEDRFLEILGAQLSADLDRTVDLSRFSEHYFAGLEVNTAMVAALADARAAGYRMGLLTNNVVEWGPRWRPTIPVEELFDDVVDSAYVGTRKPDPAIYVLAYERLGVTPQECVFVDDFAHNCEAASELGMTTVWLQDPDAAVAELRELLAERGAPGQASGALRADASVSIPH
ncbi:HAD-superfamily hydrolase [Paraconexibacter sp. AEG42_29]|uniref:HAD-superfamily hydrolase n=1 Tax=Paraconexibacter sp. AEG42_29 TaxID=2997339 RepID=A0AAU7AYF4_9ACTN